MRQNFKQFNIELSIPLKQATTNTCQKNSKSPAKSLSNRFHNIR